MNQSMNMRFLHDSVLVMKLPVRRLGANRHGDCRMERSLCLRCV